MNIDLTTEELVSLAKACRLIPPARQGQRCAPSTLFRWIRSGAVAPNGERVYLQAVRRPSGWLTSRAAIGRFLAALTPDVRQAGKAARRIRTPAARERASRRAERELDRIGI